jgi:hypothetical protein
MQINTVASILGYPAGEIRESMAQLAFGGVVQNVGSDAFCVVPTPLRCVLVKDYFFDRPVPLPLDAFLERAGSLEAVFSTLLGAKSRGAAVPQYILVDMFDKSHGSDVWEEFVWSDQSHAEIVIKRFPSRISTLERCLLAQAPDHMIPKLLEQAIGDDRPLHSTPNHSLRLLEDWVESAPQASGESIIRRRKVWNQVKICISENPSDTEYLKALKVVLSPHFEDNYLKPGTPSSFVIRSGSVVPEELQEIGKLWPEIAAALRLIDIEDWAPIFEAIDQWVYWKHPSVQISENHRSERLDTAQQMLKDLIQLCESRPGAQMEVLERATALGLSIEAQVDEVFTTLFPYDDDDGDWQERGLRQLKAVNELATIWAKQHPSKWSERMTECVKEAKSSGHVYPDYTGHLCKLIAADTKDVLQCLDALTTSGCDSYHLMPFAQKAANDRVSGWEDRFHVFLEREKWRDVAVQVLLPLPDIQDALVTETIRSAKSYPKVVQMQVRGGKIADERVLSLFAIGDSDLSEALAIGIWQMEPAGNISQSYISEWRAAVVAHVHQDYYLKQMVDSDPQLAFSWLCDRAVNRRHGYFGDAYTIAVNKLSEKQRIEVIDAVVPPAYHAAEVLKTVVGDSSVLFEHLLSKSLSVSALLSPLSGTPDPKWCELAKCALSAGHTPEDLVHVAFSDSPASVGSIASQFETQLQVWESLSSDDGRVMTVITLGETLARGDFERWSAQEKLEAHNQVYG